jgi:hypothetical protein
MNKDSVDTIVINIEPIEIDSDHYSSFKRYANSQEFNDYFKSFPIMLVLETVVLFLHRRFKLLMNWDSQKLTKKGIKILLTQA